MSLWVKEYLSNFELKLKFINFVSLSWALQMPLTNVNMRFIPFSRLSRYFRNIKAVLRECDLVVVSVVMWQLLCRFRFSNHRTRIKRVCWIMAEDSIKCRKYSIVEYIMWKKIQVVLFLFVVSYELPKSFYGFRD